MSHETASREPEDQFTNRTDDTDASDSRGVVSTLTRYLRRSADSGAITGISGIVTLIRGVRTIRRGQRGRGVVRLFVGGVLVAAAVAQRRSGNRDEGPESAVDQTDVVETSPDIGAVPSESEVGSEGNTTGDEAASVVDTGPDVEDAGSAPEVEAEDRDGTVDKTDVMYTGVDADESEIDGSETGEGSLERLGAAAFDEQDRQVPAPQRAFDRRFLVLGSEAFWGVRESDDAVFLAVDYDSIEDSTNVRYVASSEIDDDRNVTIPDDVRDHWESLLEAVLASGEDIVFLTREKPETDGVLRIAPESLLEEET